jgi:hypothetical protein
VATTASSADILKDLYFFQEKRLKVSVSTKFQKFCNDILIPSSTVNDISYRYKRITKQLNKDFWGTESETSHSLYVGSYGRDTEIHVSDIDMLMRLPVSYYTHYSNYQGNGQSALLQAVKSSIQNTYNSFIKGDGQVVVVRFTDGIRFEILPCFLNKDDVSYTYPDTHSGGSWKVTNPNPEIKAIREANDLWNKNLKRLCRMARAWKDHWSVPIGGILIDTLAYDFMEQWSHKDKSFLYYDWMVRDFMQFLATRSSTQEYWLAMGSGKRVYREGAFEHKALRCYNIAKGAVQFEAEEKDWSATQKWREIFGNKFTG